MIIGKSFVNCNELKSIIDGLLLGDGSFKCRPYVLLANKRKIKRSEADPKFNFIEFVRWKIENSQTLISNVDKHV